MTKQTRRYRWCLLLAAATVSFAMGSAMAQELQPARVFGSHMVLQRDRPVQIWGVAAPGQRVTARLADVEAAAVADGKGRWRLSLPAQPAGGPHALRLVGDRTLVYKDIFFGEVWLGSGQSNMNMALRDGRGGVLNWQQEVAAANHPRIRLLRVPNRRDRHDSALDWAWTPCHPDVAEDFPGALYFFARRLVRELDVSVGIVDASQGGSPIEPWHVEGALYRKCIAPLVPISLRGFLWYQGESNVGMASAEYHDSMRSLIGGWRAAWQAELPFYYVQIAPVLGKGAEQQPLIWEGMTRTLALPGTGMVPTMDIGDLGNVHPKNKQAVGARLASLVLREQYGRSELEPYAPRYARQVREGDALRIHFAHAVGGLITGDGAAPDWFRIAGMDRQFHWADARIDGDTVLASSPDVHDPVSVRFAWHGTAVPNLAGKASGLPVLPFRTDDWPAPESPPEPPPVRLVALPAAAGLAELGTALRREAPLKLISGGRTFARVRLGVSGADLVVDLEVLDGRYGDDGASLVGAMVEVYLSARGGTTVRQVVFHPKAVGPTPPFKVYEMGKEVAGQVKVRSGVETLSPRGYRLTAAIPFAVYGVDPAREEVGVELAVAIAGAPADPPRWMSLFNSVGAFKDNSRFCRVVAPGAAED